MSGKGALEPHGAWGGAMGGLGGLTLWDLGAVDPDAGRPGLGGLVGGWARLTRSSPNELDLVSDSGIWQLLNSAGIDCVYFNSFAGNQISHHGIFRSIGGLHPRIGILRIQVHNQQRSSFYSLVEAHVFSFLVCTIEDS